MANHRHLPDPPYTPPTDAENDLGYWFICDGCDRRWSQRYIDNRTRRCLSCARAWRRDDMTSRRKGLGGVPLVKNPPAHPFKSRTLKREVNLNSAEGKKLIETNNQFRAEVDAYISKLIADNAAPKTPLYGVLPLLSRFSRSHVKAERVELEEEPEKSSVPASAAEMVSNMVDSTVDTIDGEIVDEKPHRRGR